MLSFPIKSKPSIAYKSVAYTVGGFGKKVEKDDGQQP